MNPKVQAIFVHIITGVIFKYMLQVKDIKHIFDNNVGILGHMKVYYGCYEWKNKMQLTYPYIIMPKQFFESQHIHTNITW
jgi:hypothetical protein